MPPSFNNMSYFFNKYLKSKARRRQNKTKNKFRVLLIDCLKIKYDIHGSRKRIVNPVLTLLKPSKGTTTSTRFDLQFSRILSQNRHPGILHCPFFTRKKVETFTDCKMLKLLFDNLFPPLRHQRALDPLRTSTCRRFNLQFLLVFSKKKKKTSQKASFYSFSPTKIVRLFIPKEVKPSPDSKMTKLVPASMTFSLKLVVE